MDMQQIKELRIKLAEVMGWERREHKTTSGVIPYWYNTQSPVPDKGDCPDPFADANDDYAVLCWLRGFVEDSNEIIDALEQRSVFSVVDYEVGDYARAALTVLQQHK